MFINSIAFFSKTDILNILNGFSYYKLKYIGISIGILILFWFLRKMFTADVFKIISKINSKTKFEKNTKFISAFEKPLRTFFGILGVYLALKTLLYGLGINKIVFIDKLFSSAIIILVCWGLYNLTSESSLLFEKMKDTYDIKMDKILFPFISKTLRIVIIGLAITIVADKWGYDIKAFITGLGLGGLAFALAAKDTAANVIAGAIIILDKTFSIGDWISCSGVEGVVENISFRSTRIRTFDQALVTVPNSTLANAPITNFTKREKRRVNFNLGINHDTPKDKIEICVNNIRELLENNNNIYKDSISVGFDKFNVRTLDIFIQFFTNTIDFTEHLKVKENINYNIMDILKEQGVSLAVPITSTSVHIETIDKSIENKV